MVAMTPQSIPDHKNIRPVFLKSWGEVCSGCLRRFIARWKSSPKRSVHTARLNIFYFWHSFFLQLKM